MAAAQRTSSACSDPSLEVEGDRFVSIAHSYPEAIEMVNDILKTILVTACIYVRILSKLAECSKWCIL